MSAAVLERPVVDLDAITPGEIIAREVYPHLCEHGKALLRKHRPDVYDLAVRIEQENLA